MLVKFKDWFSHPGIGIGLVISLILLGAIPFLTDAIFYLDFMFLLFLYIALAVNWNILGGYAGYMSLAHTTFLGVGGYVSTMILIYYNVSPLLSFPIAGLCAVIIAATVGGVTLRLGIKGSYFVVLTLALNFVALNVAASLPQTGGGMGLIIPPSLQIHAGYPFRNVSSFFYEAMLIIAIVCIALSYKVLKSRLGYALLAIKDDEDVAETIGIPTFRIKLYTFMISAFMVGVTGAIYAYYLNFIDPTVMFSLEWGLFSIASSLLGGGFHWLGPVIGATILQSSNLIVGYTLTGSSLGWAIYGIVILVFLTVFPNGIMGFVVRTLEKLKQGKSKLKM